MKAIRWTGKLTAAAVIGFTLHMPVLCAQDATQTEHDRAVAAQNAHDRRHHNTAKTVGGTAAAGAVVGGVAGGGKGALIGGAVGAGGGAVADKVRKHQGVKKRQRRAADHDSNYHPQ